MFFSRPTKKGFTLIEMMVVIVIISLTSSIVIVSLSSSRANRETERSAHTVAGALREAQNYALTGRSDSANQDNCYFGLRFTSATQYELINYYRSGTTCTTYSIGIISSNTLPAGGSVTGINSFPTTLAFSLPRAEVYISNAGGAPTSMTSSQLIGITKSGQTQYVCLYPTGRIEERGANATCP